MILQKPNTSRKATQEMDVLLQTRIGNRLSLYGCV